MNKKFWMEILRVAPFLCLAGFILIPDDSRGVILFGIGILSLAVALGHIVRKILFPYIDLKSLISGIEEDTKASAAVICALVYLVTEIAKALVMLLR
jgi:hypothetical protein